MGKNVYEDEHVVITKFCGPEGTQGYQITPAKREYTFIDKDEYISVYIKR